MFQKQTYFQKIDAKTQAIQSTNERLSLETWLKINKLTNGIMSCLSFYHEEYQNTIYFALKNSNRARFARTSTPTSIRTSANDFEVTT